MTWSIPRREFLRFGYASFLGLSRLSKHVYAEHPDPDRRGEPALIEILLLGGLSHVDSFDPKPDAPRSVRGEFGSIATTIPGVRFCEHLPCLSRAANKFALLRAVSHHDTLHETSERFLLTGDSTKSAGTPEVGMVVASGEKQGKVCPVPAYIAIPGLAPDAEVSNRWSPAYNLLEGGGAILNQARKAPIEKALVDFHRRDQLRQSLDSSFPANANSRVMNRRQQVYSQVETLLASKEITNIMRLDREAPKTRQAYGATTWGEYLLLARRAIEAGSRVVTVVLGGWDMHTDIFASLRKALPPLDQALAALIEDLEQRGLLPSTTVVAIGEFGRTPDINNGGGRDHWPRAMSMLWAGGGSNAGRVLGATDQRGAEPKEGLVPLENVIYSLYHQLGIDPATVSLAPQDRKLFFGKKDLLIRDLF
ncbi:MAG TPA: DUF1501 domain-containing protein [Gemmataceae bacterium]|nr:DUF1501 domain-containing protein [Gemmataceae bacterium]